MTVILTFELASFRETVIQTIIVKSVWLCTDMRKAGGKRFYHRTNKYRMVKNILAYMKD